MDSKTVLNQGQTGQELLSNASRRIAVLRFPYILCTQMALKIINVWLRILMKLRLEIFESKCIKGVTPPLSTFGVQLLRFKALFYLRKSVQHFYSVLTMAGLRQGKQKPQGAKFKEVLNFHRGTRTGSPAEHLLKFYSPVPSLLSP